MYFDEKGLLLLDDIQAHFTSEKLKFNENRIYLLAMQVNVRTQCLLLVQFFFTVFMIIIAMVICFTDSNQYASKHKIDLFDVCMGLFLLYLFALVIYIFTANCLNASNKSEFMPNDLQLSRVNYSFSFFLLLLNYRFYSEFSRFHLFKCFINWTIFA